MVDADTKRPPVGGLQFTSLSVDALVDAVDVEPWVVSANPSTDLPLCSLERVGANTNVEDNGRLANNEVEEVHHCLLGSLTTCYDYYITHHVAVQQYSHNNEVVCATVCSSLGDGTSHEYNKVDG